jgi:hypothetical protein
LSRACAAIALSVVVLLPVPLHAAPTRTLVSGTTTLQLSTEFLLGLSLAAVDLNAVRPARLDGATVTMPIRAGALDLATGRGEFAHVGGLRLASTETEAELLNLVVDTSGEVPVISGLLVVDGTLIGRVPFFDLDLPELTLPLAPGQDKLVTIAGARVRLSQAAADALNEALGGDSIPAGFVVGTATVSARVGTPKGGR